MLITKNKEEITQRKKDQRQVIDQYNEINQDVKATQKQIDDLEDKKDKSINLINEEIAAREAEVANQGTVAQQELRKYIKEKANDKRDIEQQNLKMKSTHTEQLVAKQKKQFELK